MDGKGRELPILQPRLVSVDTGWLPRSCVAEIRVVLSNIFLRPAATPADRAGQLKSVQLKEIDLCFYRKKSKVQDFLEAIIGPNKHEIKTPLNCVIMDFEWTDMRY